MITELGDFSMISNEKEQLMQRYNALPVAERSRIEKIICAKFSEFESSLQIDRKWSTKILRMLPVTACSGAGIATGGNPFAECTAYIVADLFVDFWIAKKSANIEEALEYFPLQDILRQKLEEDA
jgi:hypothetical protein